MKTSKSLTTAISSSIAALNSQVSKQTQDEAVASIYASIQTVGQLVPIVMSGNTIIDGHKRLAACQSLGIEPKVVHLAGGQDQLAVWTSLNLCRTHLSQNERGLVASELYRLRPLDANGKKVPQAAICTNLGISDEHVRRINEARLLAKALGKETEVIANIKDGKSVRQALLNLETDKIARFNLPTSLNSKLAAAKELHKWAESNRQFSFLYADPPWAEAVKSAPYPLMPTGKSGDQPNADGTYPTVCSMAGDIKKVAAKNSVLWLWTTSSLLQNGLDVMDAWGFKYTTMIVWAKSGTNTSRGDVLPRHELILVGKMRCEDGTDLGEDQDIVLVGHPKSGAGLGSPKGRDIKPIESVVELPIQQLAHSQKPEEFAEAAGKLYPTQAKLELFARRQRTGWTTWGNQSNGAALQQLKAKTRSGGHQSNKSATAGLAKHRGRKPGKRAGQPVMPTAQPTASPTYETSSEFVRTKNILLNPGA